jgi:hypothetical protein
VLKKYTEIPPEEDELNKELTFDPPALIKTPTSVEEYSRNALELNNFARPPIKLKIVNRVD